MAGRRDALSSVNYTGNKQQKNLLGWFFLKTGIPIGIDIDSVQFMLLYCSECMLHCVVGRLGLTVCAI